MSGTSNIQLELALANFWTSLLFNNQYCKYAELEFFGAEKLTMIHIASLSRLRRDSNPSCGSDSYSARNREHKLDGLELNIEVLWIA
jgi:hypothetical protein